LDGKPVDNTICSYTEALRLIASTNFCAAWIAILLGLITGTIQGVFFHKEDWLGGYSSWKRRILRLGHISFFGMAFLNLALVMSASYLKMTDQDIAWSARLMLVALITMPLTCYLSVLKKPFRHLFFIPVISSLAGIGMFIFQIIGIMGVKPI